MDQSSSEHTIFKRTTVYMDEEKLEFLDFRTGSNMSIPREKEARRRLLIDLFYEASKPSYLAFLKIHMHLVFELIPEKLWVNNFTEQETEDVIEVQESWLWEFTIERLKVVMPEWAILDGYPRVGKSLEALKRAAQGDQCQVRFQFFKSLLREPSVQSDGWLQFCFEEFGTIVNLDAILDLSHPDNQREILVQHVAILAEDMAEVWLDMEIVRAEQGESLE
jgi:hypothetical protein